MTEDNKVKACLVETNQKVEASLLTSIQEHIQNHTQKAGIDFLHVKNTLLLSYLIDLTIYLKNKLSGKDADSANLERLTEMKVVLDKVRGLDKKLRYQIDKLLQSENASTFASAPANPNAPDDPLQYRPDPKALAMDSDDDSSSDDAASESDGDDDDDELKAAKQTMALAKNKSKSSKKKSKKDDSDDDQDKVYRAPRHTAMPYLLDKEDKEALREKRQRRKMRTSELAQSLRSQYGEAPEQEDLHGGTEYGKQAQAARKFAEKQAEKIRYEEEYMQRFTVTRKEKKEHKRLLRNEGSNLNGIADLGNLVRDADRLIDDRDGRKKDSSDSLGTKRHANGKRVKEQLDSDGRPLRKRKGGNAKNAYQAALFGGGDGGGKKKNKSRR